MFEQPFSDGFRAMEHLLPLPGIPRTSFHFPLRDFACTVTMIFVLWHQPTQCWGSWLACISILTRMSMETKHSLYPVPGTRGLQALDFATLLNNPFPLNLVLIELTPHSAIHIIILFIPTLHQQKTKKQTNKQTNNIASTDSIPHPGPWQTRVLVVHNSYDPDP